MTCPFLNEAQVKYCQCASVRKLIPLALTGGAEEKCSSAAYVSCPVYRMHSIEAPAAGTCPCLRESLMQYCGAAPAAKLIPYSESLLSRCGNDSFRYCELYLSMAHPGLSAGDVDGIAMPGWLRYSSNHMWLDVTSDGTCHAGIDAFLSRALGIIDRISFIWLTGRRRPSAVVTAAGVDLEVVFPNEMLLTNCNLYLRADPARITKEPYTAGWLFEGRPLPETTANLLDGQPARAWMSAEQRRANEFLQQQTGGPMQLSADGGLFASGLPRLLEREQTLALFHEFFPPYGGARR